MAIHTSLSLNRLFGIKSVIQTDCSSTWKIIVNPELSWYHHANPILLLVMYYTLATLIRIWLQEPLVRTWKYFLILSAMHLESLGDVVVTPKHLLSTISAALWCFPSVDIILQVLSECKRCLHRCQLPVTSTSVCCYKWQLVTIMKD